MLAESQAKERELESRLKEMESSLPYENRKAAQAELAEKKAFLAGLEKAFKEAEESYNRISRRVSDAQARLEALRGRMAEKDAEGRESAERRLREERLRKRTGIRQKGRTQCFRAAWTLEPPWNAWRRGCRRTGQHQSEARER